ncbi:hypothetical protein SLA2020_283550 [Shorea laevis]
MKGVQLVTVLVFALACSLSSAYDPSPLQDFCVAINDSTSSYAVFVNGKFCKDPKLATADDFFFSGLNTPRDTSTPLGSNFNPGHTNAVAFAGLSSQNPGLITIANAVFGSNPPINPDVLAKAFQLDRNVVNYLQKKF